MSNPNGVDGERENWSASGEYWCIDDVRSGGEETDDATFEPIDRFHVLPFCIVGKLAA